MSYSQIGVHRETHPYTQQTILETNWLHLLFLKDNILDIKIRTVGDDAFLEVYVSCDSSCFGQQLSDMTVKLENEAAFTLKRQKGFSERRIIQPNQFKLAVDRLITINLYGLDNNVIQLLGRHLIKEVVFHSPSRQWTFTKFRKSDVKVVKKAIKELFYLEP